MGRVNVFWFRRDLRLDDNAGLYAALSGPLPVLPVFVFDPNILDELPKDDARVSFLYNLLKGIDAKLRGHGSSLLMLYGKPEKAFESLLKTYDIDTVFTNRDYEPYARKRDKDINGLLTRHGAKFMTCKDQVIFEKDEIVKENGDPYVVYTPYSKRWLEALAKKDIAYHPSERKLEHFYKHSFRFPSLGHIGFRESEIKVPDFDISEDLISRYAGTRNFPAMDETSHLSPHLRFGSVPVRKIVGKANKAGDRTFLKELIWREFFMQILWHFPQTVTKSFRPKYDDIKWRYDEKDFDTWKNGRTGYPIVDAGMRQLEKTGRMHNRVRMITASFLCKHLLIDWRWGEAYFAGKLLDYEQSSNVGNWQWAAGSGTDAAPYFRIFNPEEQVKKFDKDLEYVKRWVPEYGTDDYPVPMIGHKEARERCLKVYRKTVGNEAR